MGAEEFADMCVRVRVCVRACTPLGCGCAPTAHSFFAKKIFFRNKKFKKNFLRKKCESVGAVVRACAKNGVHKPALHITIFLRCVCGCRPKSPHTKGLLFRHYHLNYTFFR